jgi:hypothetical protein
MRDLPPELGAAPDTMMEYQAISEPAQMKSLEMVFRALLLGSLLASAVAVGVVACLCLFESRNINLVRRRSGRGEGAPPPGWLTYPRRDAKGPIP